MQNDHNGQRLRFVKRNLELPFFFCNNFQHFSLISEPLRAIVTICPLKDDPLPQHVPDPPKALPERQADPVHPPNQHEEPRNGQAPQQDAPARARRKGGAAPRRRRRNAHPSGVAHDPPHATKQVPALPRAIPLPPGQARARKPRGKQPPNACRNPTPAPSATAAAIRQKAAGHPQHAHRRAKPHPPRGKAPAPRHAKPLPQEDPPNPSATAPGVAAMHPHPHAPGTGQDATATRTLTTISRNGKSPPTPRRCMSASAPGHWCFF